MLASAEYLDAMANRALVACKEEPLSEKEISRAVLQVYYNRDVKPSGLIYAMAHVCADLRRIGLDPDNHQCVKLLAFRLRNIGTTSDDTLIRAERVVESLAELEEVES